MKKIMVTYDENDPSAINIVFSILTQLMPKLQKDPDFDFQAFIKSLNFFTRMMELVQHQADSDDESEDADIPHHNVKVSVDGTNVVFFDGDNDNDGDNDDDDDDDDVYIYDPLVGNYILAGNQIDYEKIENFYKSEISNQLIFTFEKIDQLDREGRYREGLKEKFRYIYLLKFHARKWIEIVGDSEKYVFSKDYLVDHCFKALVALGEERLIDRIKHEILEFNEVLEGRALDVYHLEELIDVYKNDIINRNRILNYIQFHPGCIQNNIYKPLSLNGTKARYIIDWLGKMGIIDCKKIKNSYSLRIVNIPDQIEKNIEKKSPKDYEIQNSTLKKQEIYYKYVANPIESHTNVNAFQTMLRQAREGWPDNYEAQMLAIKKYLSEYIETNRHIIDHGEHEDFQNILCNAEELWPDDYEWQLEKIHDELSAYAIIKKIFEAHGENEDVQMVLHLARKECPDEYEEQLGFINIELSAYTKINKIIETHGEHDDFQNILDNAREEWPDNYEMQLEFVNNELSAYAKINKIIETHGDNEDIHSIFLQTREEWPSNYAVQLRIIEENL